MPDSITTALNRHFPACLVRAPGNGDLYFINGVDPIKYWDGIGGFYAANITGPSTAPTVTTPTGGAATAGDYVCYFRYKSADGRYSNLSTGTTVTAAAADQFSWSDITTSADSRVTTVQLLRSTSGQSATLYLVAEINNGTATYSSDTASDVTLQASTRVPILNGDGSVNADRFIVSHDKAVAVSFYDRFWYAVNVNYDIGSCTVTNGSASVVGINTDWTSEMVGRKMYFDGADDEYSIDSINTGNQTITLSTTYAGSTSSFLRYQIRPARTERQSIYWSAVLEPGSVPATYSGKIQDDGDSITGLMPLRNFLYALENRHIYKIGLCCNPVNDLTVQYMSSRGCVNQRSWVRVEEVAYLLDHEGIHRFDGASSQHVSGPIQDYWRDGLINWSASKWFHASHNPAEEVIRFHVALGEDTYPQSAICHHYRRQEWWIEEYPWQLACNAIINVKGDRVPAYGSEHEKFYIAEGTHDGISISSVRGTVDSATSLSITDASATLSSTMVSAPLSIVAGTGKGQTRRIHAVNTSTGKIQVMLPWITLPDTTSEYQIGGVEWKFKTPIYRFPEKESNNLRRFCLTATPTTSTNSLDVRTYLDHATTPENYRSDERIWPNVTIAADEPDAVVNLAATQDIDTPWSGWSFVRNDGSLHPRQSSNRFIQYELRGFQGEDAIKLHEVVIDGGGGP